MPEHVFFEDAGVKVTNTRFVAGGRTFAVSGITSVSLSKITPQRKGPIAVGVLSILLLLGSRGDTSILVVGLVLLAAAVVYWFVDSSRYSVRLMTASGESDAFSAKDELLVGRVVDALNEAIIARG